MFMCFVGMGIGHQGGSTNTNISDSMDCDPDACEESEDYGDDKSRQGGNEDVSDGDEDTEEEEGEDTEEEDGEEDQDDDQDSEHEIGYSDL